MERIDWEVIKNYKALTTKSGENLYMSLLERFKEKVFDDLETLKSFQESENYDELAKLSHKLKSSTGNLGMLSASEALNEIEESITVHKKSDFTYFKTLVIRVESEVTLLLQEISENV
ncbi:MAG: Hpt domain-containing protein [Bdellovibrionota bacterium]|nr:Hpt domain-containing protein [Bdellovibrionota bacterium]